MYSRGGFTFDAGPTVITAPWLFDELFAVAGRDRTRYVRMVPLDPFYRIFFHDGASFDYAADAARMEAQVRALDPRDVAGYRAFVRRSGQIFAKGFTELADTPFLSPWDMVRVAPALVRLHAFRTVYGMVSSYVRDERLRQVLSFHPLLVGGNPFQATSIYALIHYLERKWGVWYAMGGTGTLVEALCRIFDELGGRLCLDHEVGRIDLDARGRACGVTLVDGRTVPADAVVCNGDVVDAYRRLVPARVRRRNTDARLGKLRQSMSLVVIYFGTDRRYGGESGAGLAHHTIMLGPRYGPLLEDVFVRKRLAEDFSLYLHTPTLTDPSLAPPGCEAFYVLAPVPHLGSGVDWARQAKPYRDRIMSFLEDRYLPDLRRHIVVEHMIDPRYFRDALHSHLGSAFSVEPVLTQSAYFRPHNRSDDVPNLYFVGAGTHPGAGLPGVLSGAKIVERLICDEPRS